MATIVTLVVTVALIMTFPGKMPDVSRHGLQCSVYKYMLFVETNAFFFEIFFCTSIQIVWYINEITITQYDQVLIQKQI